MKDQIETVNFAREILSEMLARFPEPTCREQRWVVNAAHQFLDMTQDDIKE
jgi:hypothetical protein